MAISSINPDFGHADAASATRNRLSTSLQNFHRNRPINDFLNEDSKSIIVGAKGMGKTLLLIKKAMSKLEDASVLTIPTDTSLPVDRLTCAEDLGMSFSRRTANPTVGLNAWMAVWRNALLKSCLHHLCFPSGKLEGLDLTIYSEKESPLILSKLSSHIKSLVGEPPYFIPKTPFEFYAEVMHFLDESPNQGIHRIHQENATLKELLKLSEKPIYIFLDNLDSYYESQPRVWFDSMFGLFRCVREMRLDFRNIHLFVSLRKDIFNGFETEHRTLLLDYVIELRYSDDELLTIFETGIRNLDPSRMHFSAWQHSEPWKAFFDGVNWVPDRFVKDGHWLLRDLVLCHSMRRPRDLITIGNKLLEVKGSERLTASLIRSGIEEAMKEISRQYLAELAPATPKPFELIEFLKGFVPKNILSASGVSDAVKKYKSSGDGKSCESLVPERDEFNPFAILYSVGLLGYVRQDGATSIQEFLRPGESIILMTTDSLPKSSHYVLHPVLNHLLDDNQIDRRQMTGYRQSFRG